MAIRDLEIVQLSRCTLCPDMHTSIQIHLCFQSQFSIDHCNQKPEKTAPK